VDLARRRGGGGEEGGGLKEEASDFRHFPHFEINYTGISIPFNFNIE
jgi:hypothetical protein